MTDTIDADPDTILTILHHTTSPTPDRLIATLTMPNWHDTPLQNLLEQALGLPVVVENDANLGALAEHRWGAARGCHNVVYVYLGSAGNGCGLILEGRLYRGDIGSAGEIGHLKVAEHGSVCRCGASGCLDAVVSEPALLKHAHALGLPCTQIQDIIQLAHQGNDKALVVIEAAGAGLGTVLTSLLDIVNPGCVVIGGSLAAAGDLLLRSLQARFDRRRVAAAVEHVAIVPGVLGGDVVALGGVAALVQQVFRIPVAILPTDN